MSKLLRILFCSSLMVLAPSAHSHQPYYGPHYGRPHYHHYPSNPNSWVVPAIVGGVLTYEVYRHMNPPPVVVQQPPVIIQQTPQTESCTQWREVQSSDGRIYRERTCTAQ